MWMCICVCICLLCPTPRVFKVKCLKVFLPSSNLCLPQFQGAKAVFIKWYIIVSHSYYLFHLMESFNDGVLTVRLALFLFVSLLCYYFFSVGSKYQIDYRRQIRGFKFTIWVVGEGGGGLKDMHSGTEVLGWHGCVYFHCGNCLVC